jgi:antibiotic biosynthesis monooxygenase
MFMTIREYRMPPSQIDEVIRRVDEDWLDLVSKMKGFVSYQVVRLGDEGLVSLTNFLDAEDGERAAEASAEWVGAHLMDLDVQFIDMRRGPIVVHGGS